MVVTILILGRRRIKRRQIDWCGIDRGMGGQYQDRMLCARTILFTENFFKCNQAGLLQSQLNINAIARGRIAVRADHQQPRPTSFKIRIIL